MSKFPSFALALVFVLTSISPRSDAATLVAEWDLNGGNPATKITAQTPTGTDSADFSTTTGLSWSGLAGAAPGSTDWLEFSGANAANTLNTGVSGTVLAGTGAKTFVAWIKPTAGNGGIVSYSPQGGNAAGGELRFLLDGNGHLRGEVSGGYFVYTGTDVRNDGWKMVAAIFDGNTNTSKFYLGGAGLLNPDTVVARSIDTVATLGVSPKSELNLVLGAIHAAGYAFTGGIDMVKVYDGALSEAELDTLYAGTMPPAPADPAGPVAQWDLNEGSPAATITSTLPAGVQSAAFSTAAGAGWGGSNSDAPGSTDYLNFSGSNARNTLNTGVSGAGLAGTGAKTFVAWIKPTAGNGGIVSYSPQGGNLPGGDLRFLIDANGHLRGEVSGGYFVYTGTDVRNDGWKMVAAVFDGNTNASKFYLGGSGMLTPDTVAARAINTAGTLGAGSNSEMNYVIGSIQANGYGFTGGIDMVKVFDRALTSAELDSLFTTGMLPGGPLVFISTKVAAPGDLIILHGARFTSETETPEVWIDEITGSNDTPNPETPINVVSSSDTVLHAEIPAGTPEGLYAVFVKRGSAVSEPVWVNRADAWQALDLAGTEIDPNRDFRLYGWNLEMGGATSQVFFEDTATSQRIAATVTDSNRANIVKLTAPATLVPGEQYRLIVSNGYGGNYGETVGPVLDCIPTPADPLGLEVPWAAEYDFVTNNVYNVKTDPRLSQHAVGDGVTDDLAALKEACDAATADGGGCVYLPAGNYLLSSRLEFQRDVVVRGAGMDETTVIGSMGVKLSSAAYHNGVMDLTLTSGRLQLAGSQWTPEREGPMIVVRTRIHNELDYTGGDEGKALLMNGCDAKGLVKDSVIITDSVTHKGTFEAWRTANLLVKNTTFQWNMGRLEALFARNIQFDNCTFSRTTESDGDTVWERNGVPIGRVNYGALELSNASHVAVIDSVFDKIPDPDHVANPELHPDRKIFRYGDGETILHQGMSRYGLGYVTSATPTTLTDATILNDPPPIPVPDRPTRQWDTNELVDNHYLAGIPCTVMIVGGPGAGQSRTIISNTADTVTIDKPWDIVPTTESAYAVIRSEGYWMIVGNTFKECPPAIWLYGCALHDVVIADNNLTNCLDIYLRASQYAKDDSNEKYHLGPRAGQYQFHGVRYGGFRNVLIENNEQSSDGSDLSYPVQLSCHAVIEIANDPNVDNTSLGNQFWDVMIRKNEINSMRPNKTVGNLVGVTGEGFFAIGRSWTPANFGTYHGEYLDGLNAMHGVVFDRNAAINLDKPFHTSTGVMQTTIWKPVLTNTGTATIVDTIIPPAANGAVDTTYVPVD